MWEGSYIFCAMRGSFIPSRGYVYVPYLFAISASVLFTSHLGIVYKQEKSLDS